MDGEGLLVVPTAEDWENDRYHLRDWHDDPECERLSTPTARRVLLHRLAEHYPDDVERPPVPHFVPYGESHQESLLHPRSKEFRSCSSPTIRVGACTRTTTTTPGAVRSRPARSSARRLRLRASVDQPAGRRSPEHARRRHRPHVQRPRRGSGRRASVRTRHPPAPCTKITEPASTTSSSASSTAQVPTTSSAPRTPRRRTAPARLPTASWSTSRRSTCSSWLSSIPRRSPRSTTRPPARSRKPLSSRKANKHEDFRS